MSSYDLKVYMWAILPDSYFYKGEHCGLMVEPRILEQEVRGSIPTSAVLCP